MFHADFLIDDKDVVKLHYALAGLRVFNVDIKPAVNVKAAKANEVVEAPVALTATGRAAEVIAVELRKHFDAGDQVTRKAVFNTAIFLGYSPNSKTIEQLIEAKVLRKKARGVFVMLKH